MIQAYTAERADRQHIAAAGAEHALHAAAESIQPVFRHKILCRAADAGAVYTPGAAAFQLHLRQAESQAESL